MTSPSQVAMVQELLRCAERISTGFVDPRSASRENIMITKNNQILELSRRQSESNYVITLLQNENNRVKNENEYLKQILRHQY